MMRTLYALPESPRMRPQSGGSDVSDGKISIRSNGRLERRRSSFALRSSGSGGFGRTQSGVKRALEGDTGPTLDFLALSQDEDVFLRFLGEGSTIPPQLDSLMMPPAYRREQDSALTLKTVEDLSFFQHLKPEQRAEVVACATLELYVPGELVMRVGERVDRVCIVFSGTLRSYSYTTQALLKFKPPPPTEKEKERIRPTPSLEKENSAMESAVGLPTIASMTNSPAGSPMTSTAASRGGNLLSMAAHGAAHASSTRSSHGTAHASSASRSASPESLARSSAEDASGKGSATEAVPPPAFLPPTLSRKFTVQNMGPLSMTPQKSFKLSRQGTQTFSLGKAAPAPPTDPLRELNRISKPSLSKPSAGSKLSDHLTGHSLFASLAAPHHLDGASSSHNDSFNSAPSSASVARSAHSSHESAGSAKGAATQDGGAGTPRGVIEAKPAQSHKFAGRKGRWVGHGGAASSVEKKGMAKKIGVKVVEDKAKTMLRHGQYKVGAVELLKGGSAGWQMGVWEEVEMRAEASGLLEVTWKGREQTRKLGNIRECVKLDPIRVHSRSCVMRLHWKSGWVDLVSCEGREELLEWKGVFEWLHSKFDHDVLSYLARLKYFTTMAAGDVCGSHDVVTTSAYHAESARRTTTVVCEKAAMVLAIKRADYVRVTKGVEILTVQDKLKALRMCEPLCLMRPLDLMVIAKACVGVEAVEREVVVRKGCAAEAVYVVVNGAVTQCEDLSEPQADDGEHVVDIGMGFSGEIASFEDGEGEETEEKDEPEYEWQVGSSVGGSQTARERGRWGAERLGRAGGSEALASVGASALDTTGGGAHERPVRSKLLERIQTLGPGDAFGHEEALLGRSYKNCLVAETGSVLLSIPAHVIKDIIQTRASSAKEAAATSGGASNKEQDSRVWLSANGQEVEEDAAEGAEVDQGRVVSMASGNAHRLIQGGGFKALDKATPSLDDIMAAYPFRDTGRKQARQTDPLQIVDEEVGDKEGERNEAGSPASATAADSGKEEVAEDASGDPNVSGIGPLVADVMGGDQSGECGGDQRPSSRVAQEIVGGVDPGVDTPARIDTIRMQFKSVQRGSDFAMRGYETPRGSFSQSQREEMVRRPRVDLDRLKQREGERGRMGSREQDWDAQMRFGLSDRERDLVADMRRVMDVRGTTARGQSQRVMDLVLKAQAEENRLSADGLGGEEDRVACKIARFENLPRGPSGGIEDMLRCALREVDSHIEALLVYPQAQESAAFLVFDHHDACFTAINKGLLLGLKATESTADDLARHHVTFSPMPSTRPSILTSSPRTPRARPLTNSRHTSLPSDLRNLSRAHGQMMARAHGGMSGKLGALARAKSRPPLSVARDNLRPVTAL